MAPYKGYAKFNNQARVATTAFLLFCLSLFVTAYSARNPEAAKVGFQVIAEAQRPFQEGSDTVFNWINSTWESYFNLINVKEENQELLRHVAELESVNSTLLEFKNENERLRKMLSAVEDRKLSVIAGNVISYDAMSYSGSIILDRGSNQGVLVDMPVLQADNVVGQIIAVSLNTSKSLLLTDPSSAVDTIVQRSRVRGTVRGLKKHNLLDLQYVLPEDDVQVGDRIITSGMDGIFPKGLLVGIVSLVAREGNGMFQRIQLRPSVDFAKLESVLIVIDKKNE